jgi:hypothetical protein
MRRATMPGTTRSGLSQRAFHVGREIVEDRAEMLSQDEGARMLENGAPLQDEASGFSEAYIDMGLWQDLSKAPLDLLLPSLDLRGDVVDSEVLKGTPEALLKGGDLVNLRCDIVPGLC